MTKLFINLKLEVGTAPSSAAAVPTYSVNTALLRYVYPAPSSKFYFSLELEGGTAASTIDSVSPSSEFSFVFAI